MRSTPFENKLNKQNKVNIELGNSSHKNFLLSKNFMRVQIKLFCSAIGESKRISTLNVIIKEKPRLFTLG